MIKIRASLMDGHYSITMDGHADPDICAAASMIMHSAALGLRDLARHRNPKQISFEASVFGNHTDKIDSRRKIR